MAPPRVKKTAVPPEKNSFPIMLKYTKRYVAHSHTRKAQANMQSRVNMASIRFLNSWVL
jgi:hypothetical protein